MLLGGGRLNPDLLTKRIYRYEDTNILPLQIGIHLL